LQRGFFNFDLLNAGNGLVRFCRGLFLRVKADAEGNGNSDDGALETHWLGFESEN
jgi:hypothetical protein